VIEKLGVSIMIPAAWNLCSAVCRKWIRGTWWLRLGRVLAVSNVKQFRL